MQITLSFETPISRPDISILQALVATGTVPAETGSIAKETTKGVEAPEAPKPAAKTTPAPAKKAAAAPPKEEAKEEAKEEKTPREVAIERATALVGEGKHLLVKKALAEVSVARVSQLEDGDVEAFLAALDEG